MLRPPGRRIGFGVVGQDVGDLGVQSLSAQSGDAGQQLIAQQAVGELVTIGGVRRDHDALVGRLIEVVGERVEIQSGGRGEHRHGSGVDHVADHRRRPQHSHHRRVQRGEPAIQHRAHSARNLVGGALFSRQPGVFGYEERVAACAGGKLGGLVGRHRVLGHHIRQRRNVFRRKRRNGDVAVVLTARHRAQQPRHLRGVVAVAQREHHQNPVVAQRAGDVGQAARRCGVGPLHVVDHHGQQPGRSLQERLNSLVDKESRGIRISVRGHLQRVVRIATQRAHQLTHRPPRRRGPLIRAVHPHHVAARRRGHRADLFGQPCLADSGRTREHQPSRRTRADSGQQFAGPRQLPDPAHQRRPRRHLGSRCGVVSGRRRHRDRMCTRPFRRPRPPRQLGCLPQHRGLQLPQLPPRLQAQLLVEALRVTGVGLQRLGRPAGSVQRQHLQPAAAVGERIERSQRRRFGHRPRHPAEREQRDHVVGHALDPHLGEPGRIVAQPRRARQVVEQITTNQAECLTGCRSRLLPVLGLDRGTRPLAGG